MKKIKEMKKIIKKKKNDIKRQEWNLKASKKLKFIEKRKNYYLTFVLFLEKYFVTVVRKPDIIKKYKRFRNRKYNFYYFKRIDKKEERKRKGIDFKNYTRNDFFNLIKYLKLNKRSFKPFYVLHNLSYYKWHDRLKEVFKNKNKIFNGNINEYALIYDAKLHANTSIYNIWFKKNQKQKNQKKKKTKKK